MLSVMLVWGWGYLVIGYGIQQRWQCRYASALLPPPLLPCRQCEAFAAIVGVVALSAQLLAAAAGFTRI